MKFGLKKKITIGAMTTIALAPVATVLACSGGSIDLIPVDTKIIGNQTVDDLAKLSRNSETEAISDRFLEQVKYEVSEMLFNEEQSESLKTQIIYFNWDIKNARNNMLEIANDILSMVFINGKPSAADTDTDDKKIDIIKNLNVSNLATAYQNDFRDKKGQYDNRVEDIRKLNEKIAILNDNKVNYDAATFASDYPRVLRPLDKEKEQQTRVYNERKTTFINNYTTGNDGLKAWIENIKTSYGGATDDGQAIKYLIDQVISKSAFGKFQFKINDEFTVEQFNATNREGKKIFPWFEGKTLTKSDTLTTPSGIFYVKDPTNKDNKIYFLSRVTQRASEFVVQSFDASAFGNWISSGSRPVSINHALIAAKPDFTKPFEPWTISKETLKKILSYYSDDTGAPVQSYELFKSVFSIRSGMSDEAATANDDKFINYFSDDASGRNKLGDLGVNSLSGYISQMVPGFSLGVLAAISDNDKTKDPAADFGLQQNDGIAVLNDLFAKVHDVINGAIGIDNIGSDPNAVNRTGMKNRAVNDWVTALTDDEVKTKFGTIFSAKFRGANLAYRISGTNYTNGTYLVISENGLHMIKINELGPTNGLAKSLESDFNIIANGNDVSKAKTKWADLFTSIYDNPFIIHELLNDAVVGEKVKTLINKIETTNPALYKEWKDNKFIRTTSTGTETIVEATERMIASVQTNKAINDAESAIGDKISTFLTNAIIARQLNEQISPSVVNNRAYIELGVKNEN